MAEHVPGTPLYITGTVRDLAGRTVGGAVLDVWQADPKGRYEAQVDTARARMRGKYTSQSDGTYCLRTVAPLGYSIPMDGPVGQLISRTGISHHRPAHVHFLVTAPDYEPLITQLFQKGAPYLDSDVVFGTKAQLVAWLQANYDFVLQRTAATTQPEH